MQYNYIHIGNIQGDDKLSISRTLKNCQDIELFESESIQLLIDFKWNCYTKQFFLSKFYMYTTFVIVYYMDIESGLYHMEQGK